MMDPAEEDLIKTGDNLLPEWRLESHPFSASLPVSCSPLTLPSSPNPRRAILWMTAPIIVTYSAPHSRVRLNEATLGPGISASSQCGPGHLGPTLTRILHLWCGGYACAGGWVEVVVVNGNVTFTVSFRPSYVTTYLPTYLPIYYLPTYLSTYISTYISTYLSTNQPTYLPTYLPTHPPTHLPEIFL